jgi:hypothetical protein
MHPHLATRIHALVGGAVTAVLIVGGFLVAGNAARGDEAPNVVINEVEWNDAVDKDWVELTDVGTEPVDVSGWVL